MSVAVLLFEQANKFSAKAKIHSCERLWGVLRLGSQTVQRIELGLIWKPSFVICATYW